MTDASPQSAARVLPDASVVTDTAARFAVLLPVVPRGDDLTRANGFLESLAFHEPRVAWCVLVEDAPNLSGPGAFVCPSGCQLISLLNPRRGRGWRGSYRLTAGILSGLAWIQANTDADFVLKVDTDALVIAPFSRTIQCVLKADGCGPSLVEIALTA